MMMLEEAQAGIKISGRNINNLRYADDTTLMIFIKPFNFSFFSITGRGIDLYYCDMEW